MLLRRLVLSMILAAIIEFILWIGAIKFFEMRFLRKAKSISLLYDATYQFIADNFNEDNAMKISVKYQHCGSKIKIRSGLEASLKIELLIHKAFKDYYIVKWLLEWVENESEKLDVDEAKEFLEEICYEMRELINKQSPQ